MHRSCQMVLIVGLVVTALIFWLTASHRAPATREAASMAGESRQENVTPGAVPIAPGKGAETLERPEQSPSASPRGAGPDRAATAIPPRSQDRERLEREARGRQLLAGLQQNFDGLERASYQLQWECQTSGDEGDNYLAEVAFKRPFYYFERATGGRAYTYFSENTFEQYTYDAHSRGFVGETETPELAAVNEGDGFLERCPLRILQTQNMQFVREETMEDPNGHPVVCDVLRDGYWQVYVPKNSNVVSRADYYRQRDATDDVILSLSNFKYGTVELGVTETGAKRNMEFPVSFQAVYPATGWKYTCRVLNLKANDPTSFDDSVFKYRPPLHLTPESNVGE